MAWLWLATLGTGCVASEGGQGPRGELFEPLDDQASDVEAVGDAPGQPGRPTTGDPTNGGALDDPAETAAAAPESAPTAGGAEEQLGSAQATEASGIQKGVHVGGEDGVHLGREDENRGARVGGENGVLVGDQDEVKGVRVGGVKGVMVGDDGQTQGVRFGNQNGVVIDVKQGVSIGGKKLIGKSEATNE